MVKCSGLNPFQTNLALLGNTIRSEAIQGYSWTCSRCKKNSRNSTRRAYEYSASNSRAVRKQPKDVRSISISNNELRQWHTEHRVGTTTNQISSHRSHSTLSKTSPDSTTGDDPSAVKRVRTRRKFPKYTTDDKLKILQLYDQGYTWQAIAKHFNRPTVNISRYFDQSIKHKFGSISAPPSQPPTLKPPKDLWTQEEKRTLDALKSQGLSSRAIAQQLGRSRTSIFGHVKHYFKNGQRDAHYRRLQEREPDSLGRKKRKPFEGLEMLTVYYLRAEKKWGWREIAELFPSRHVASIRHGYFNRWVGRYEGLVESDPRGWSKEKVEAVVSLGKEAASVSRGTIGGKEG